MFNTRFICIVVVLLLLGGTLHADILVLRDGRRIEGELISFQNGVIEFRESGFFGSVGRINRDDVVGIEFGRVENGNRDRDREGNRDRDREGQQQGPPRGMREKQIMVVANQPWTDTGIDITSGQSMYFQASGEIVWGPNRRAGPEGEHNSPNNSARPIPNRPGGSLIGRIGASSDNFFIGDDRGAIRPRTSGRLYLGVNDDNLRDNSGYFRVIVYY